MKVLLLALFIVFAVVASQNKFLRVNNSSNHSNSTNMTSERYVFYNKFERYYNQMIVNWTNPFPNSSNDSNYTNTTSDRYVFYNKHENNYNQILVNWTNNTSPNSSNETNVTFVHNRNFYTVEQRFFHGSNDTYETFDQYIYKNESSSYMPDGLHVFLDTVYFTKHVHYYTSNDYLNNTYSNNYTINNYTFGNTVFSTENHFAYYTRHYNIPTPNGTNNTNISSFKNSNKTRKIYGKNRPNSNKNNTPYYPDIFNTSNTTNFTVVLENFNNVDNNYNRRFFNFSQSYSPCNFQSQPFCINETVSYRQYTTENEFTDGYYLVQNITHTYERDSFFDVYYNPWYGLPFFDVHYNKSVNETWELIYVNNTY